MKPARREAYFSCLKTIVEHSANSIELLCKSVFGLSGRYTNKADKSALNGIMMKRVYALQITVKPHSNIDDNPYPINWTAEAIGGYTPTWAIISGGDRSFIHSLRWINGTNIQTVTYNHYSAALTATVTLTVIYVRNGCI